MEFTWVRLPKDMEEVNGDVLAKLIPHCVVEFD